MAAGRLLLDATLCMLRPIVVLGDMGEKADDTVADRSNREIVLVIFMVMAVCVYCVLNCEIVKFVRTKER